MVTFVVIVPPTVGGGGGSLKGQKRLGNEQSLIGVSRGVGSLRLQPFLGGGMDNLWNYTTRNP